LLRDFSQNSSVKSKGKVFAICDEWEEISRFINERPEIKEVVNDIKLSTQFNAYMWNAIRIDERFHDEFIDRFQSEFKIYYKNGEIGDNFYKKVKKAELQMLLNDKESFKECIKKFALKQEQKEKRQQWFSVRINTSRISVVMFGKQIMEIG
jgi:tRNA A37 N6-isopentenylltransferase MiaA